MTQQEELALGKWAIDASEQLWVEVARRYRGADTVLALEKLEAAMMVLVSIDKYRELLISQEATEKEE